MKSQHYARTNSRFTLIELLVVIAVIAILVAMLLPALSRAKYQAKLALCVNHQKQASVAFMAVAADSDNYYPRNTAWRTSLNQLKENFNRQNIIPILKPYLEDGLTSLGCPIAPRERSINHSQYQLFFNTDGVAEGRVIGNDTGRKIIQYGLNGNPLTRTVPAEDKWYYQSQRGLMRKVGQSWEQTATGDRYQLLMADTVIPRSHSSHKMTITNHHDFSTLLTPNDHWMSKFQYATPNGSGVYEKTSGFFTGTDGHVQRYAIPAPYGTWNGGDFITIAQQIVPTDFKE